MHFSWNIRGRIITFDRPQVMGIVNATPDSFWPGSRAMTGKAVEERVRKLIDEGADMLDLGAYSSRPGAKDVSAAEEIARLRVAMEALRKIAPEIIVSVDTFRAQVARVAVEELGCDVINDIAGGTLDPEMFDTVAALHCPYILMHMRGTPATMQSLTEYPQGVSAGVLEELARLVQKASLAGIADIVVDPGFGFAKTTAQNYQLLEALPRLAVLDKPLLVGVSRKSMITKVLDVSADSEEALDGTTVINTLALESGASILRVHNPLPARVSVDIRCYINSLKSCQ